VIIVIEIWKNSHAVAAIQRGLGRITVLHWSKTEERAGRLVSATEKTATSDAGGFYETHYYQIIINSKFRTTFKSERIYIWKRKYNVELFNWTRARLTNGSKPAKFREKRNFMPIIQSIFWINALDKRRIANWIDGRKGDSLIWQCWAIIKWQDANHWKMV